MVSQSLIGRATTTRALHSLPHFVIGPAFIDTLDLPAWPTGLPGLVAACLT
jgi:hypothetical protein